MQADDESEYIDRMINCYLVTKNTILLSFRKTSLVFDGNLVQLKQIVYSELDKSLTEATCIHSGVGSNNRFITSFKLDTQ